MVKSLEGKMQEEHLRPLGLSSPEQGRPRGGLMAACSSLTRGAEGQALSSALWGQRQDPRDGGGQAGCYGKVLHPEGGQALGQAPQGNGHQQACQSSKSILTMLSDIWFDFWVVQCVARSCI